ncbi:annexin A1 isoform X1 [Nothobranchius furzeri]|uniref:Annexin n=2 Tax=Nothobranchius furzeri TaxID=105023 RepID=A0A8C6K892_NOTFU|nr:annexin A1 isoform X1 [Nothobranchius furzeri]KAF7217732.1 transcript variant X1 [Nothobranchius furzeri]KAF7217733.1 transcript variant X2 [Nothobranchius furzeri]
MSMFTKFFKGLIHKRDPEEHPVTVKEKPKPKFYGTVAPYPNFNASTDASVLQSAIESKHEDVIVSVLVKRNNDQRQMIKAVYESSTGKNLVKSLESVLSSHLEDASLALLMKPAYYDAHLLRNATKGVGTDEAVLVEVLATRSNKEIEEIKQVFKKEYGVDLERAIKDETSGDFTQALLSMLSAKKDESTVVDMELARKDAQILFEAAETSRKVNVSTFINILTTRSGPQLSKTFQNYAAISDITLPKALQMDLKGDIEECLIDIVKCAWNTPAFFAEKLCHAMKGVGTRDRTLIRILVSRSEVDLKKIVEEYQAMFGRSLQDDIVADTKGEYQKVLLGLCGAQ